MCDSHIYTIYISNSVANPQRRKQQSQLSLLNSLYISAVSFRFSWVCYKLVRIHIASRETARKRNDHFLGVQFCRKRLLASQRCVYVYVDVCWLFFLHTEPQRVTLTFPPCTATYTYIVYILICTLLYIKKYILYIAKKLAFIYPLSLRIYRSIRKETLKLPSCRFRFCGKRGVRNCLPTLYIGI